MKHLARLATVLFLAAASPQSPSHNNLPLSVSHGPFVYLNNAGQSFTDTRATCGIQHGPAGSRDDGDWHGYAFGDFDQDGNLDLYVAEGAQAKQGGTNKRNNLFRGHGDGTFEYASETVGIPISTERGPCAFWIDYDNDGLLDLFVKNYAGSNVLYKNNRDGTLTSVPGAAGLAAAAAGKDDGGIVSFADYENDDFMDVMIIGMETSRNSTAIRETALLEM